ncbi:hypothetical protein GCM10023085_60290 [Actinomadura viridis]|uniref:Secreted protein n=1 Tax=Actinomadura viridis TaxID=58110 RepID=A0A931DL15_9ACTN|nr:hypothetical protein [Actinomadura viridis]MBG6090523.1 hypothetical protein [Actinomadura viridis]
MKWRRKVLASMTLLVLTVSGLAALQAPAAAAPLDLANFQFRPASNAAELRERVSLLDQTLVRVGVGDIMNDLNRKDTEKPIGFGEACEPAALQSTNKPLITRSLCFNDGDNVTPTWYPQGVTTVADAQADQVWGTSSRPVIVTWYDHNDDDGVDSDGDGYDTDEQIRGVRVTFMNPDTGAYRHVLLVYPFINDSGNVSYMSVRTTQSGEYKSLHAGGIVWYGNYLYVADTARGFRVFDMRHIYDLGASENGTTDKEGLIGRQDGIYYGHGYRYVMPEVNAWTRTADTGTKCTEQDGSPQFSYVGLDRSGVDHITAGEYCAGEEAVNGRVAAWPIAGAVDANGEQRIAADYRWNADAAYRLPDSNIQGAVRFDGRWYLSRSRGESTAGTLYKTDLVTAPTGDLRIGVERPLSIGPEDLSHWPGGTETAPSLSTLWTVAEHPGKRMVYGVYAPPG